MREIAYLSALPAVERVAGNRIIYTEEFKHSCMRRYRAGDSPVVIFREAGLDSALIGNKRIERCIARWKRTISGASFPLDEVNPHPQRPRRSQSMADVRNMPPYSPLHTTDSPLRAADSAPHATHTGNEVRTGNAANLVNTAHATRPPRTVHSASTAHAIRLPHAAHSANTTYATYPPRVQSANITHVTHPPCAVQSDDRLDINGAPANGASPSGTMLPQPQYNAAVIRNVTAPHQSGASSGQNSALPSRSTMALGRGAVQQSNTWSPRFGPQHAVPANGNHGMHILGVPSINSPTHGSDGSRQEAGTPSISKLQGPRSPGVQATGNQMPMASVDHSFNVPIPRTDQQPANQSDAARIGNGLNRGDCLYYDGYAMVLDDTADITPIIPLDIFDGASQLVIAQQARRIDELERKVEMLTARSRNAARAA